MFLKPEYEQYKKRLVELAHKDDEASYKEFQGFVFEGMRHAGVVPGLPRVANKDVTINDGARGPIHIRAEQTVLIGTSKASMDPEAFPNPEKLDPFRPLSSYILLGHVSDYNCIKAPALYTNQAVFQGLHFCFGARLVGPALVATLKEVFKLKNLRRAPGRQGHLNEVVHEVAGVPMKSYLDQNSKESPIPTTMTLEYDE